MSFLKKAVKKVFKFVRKIVKSKIFKWVAIAALTFFTAGVAAGGFAAFTGVTGVGSFFTAVGQTIATGAASVANMLGFQGVSGSLASKGGAAAIQAGLTTSATSATGAALTANAAAGTINTAGGGVLAAKGGEAVALSAKGIAAATAATQAQILSAAGNVIGAIPGLQGAGTAIANTQLGLVANGLATAAPSAGIGANVWKGIQVGFAAMAASSARKNNRKRPTFVAGGLSRGGSAELGPQPFFVVGGSDNKDTAPLGESAPQAPSTQQATLAGTLARRPPEVDNSGTTITGAPSSLSVPGPAQNVDPNLVGVGPQAPPTQGGVLFPQPQQDAQAASSEGFFKNFTATNIQTPARKSSLEDRLFNGILSGVG